jgi:hypothetical protein
MNSIERAEVRDGLVRYASAGDLDSFDSRRLIPVGTPLTLRPLANPGGRTRISDDDIADYGGLPDRAELCVYLDSGERPEALPRPSIQCYRVRKQ